MKKKLAYQDLGWCWGDPGGEAWLLQDALHFPGAVIGQGTLVAPEIIVGGQEGAIGGDDCCAVTCGPVETSAATSCGPWCMITSGRGADGDLGHRAHLQRRLRQATPRPRPACHKLS